MSVTIELMGAIDLKNIYNGSQYTVWLPTFFKIFCVQQKKEVNYSFNQCGFNKSSK